MASEITSTRAPLTSLSLIAPITSLAILPTHILAGCSFSILLIPRPTTTSTITPVTPPKKQIFARTRIHGIHPTPTHILFFGGRSFRVSTLPSILTPHTPPDGTETITTDWLFAAQLHKGKVYAITAHNILLIYTPTPTGSWVLETKANCGVLEQPLLYSADLRIGDEGVNIIAGTITGGITVWRWDGGGGEGKVTTRLKGHQGSVFCVKLHGEEVLSCADDRTVRLWDLVTGKCRVGWGHYSRPWRAGFLDDGRCVSVGEDLTVRVWARGEGELRCERSVDSHEGRSIWCFVMEQERGWVVTGGNDGKVGLLDISGEGERVGRWEVGEVVGTVREVVGGREKWKGYAFVDASKLVATTVSGCVLLHDVEAGNWELLLQHGNLVNWSIVTPITNTPFVVIGDAAGNICLLDTTAKTHSWHPASSPPTTRKVTGVFNCGYENGTLCVVTSTLETPSFSIHTFTTSPSTHTILTLPTPRNRFYITAASLSPPHLYLSSHNGHLAHYTLTSPSPPITTRLSATPITSLLATATALTLTTASTLQTYTLPLPSTPLPLATHPFPHPLLSPTTTLKSSIFHHIPTSYTHPLPTPYHHFHPNPPSLLYPSSDNKHLHLHSSSRFLHALTPTTSGRPLKAALPNAWGGEDTLLHPAGGKAHTSCIFGIAQNREVTVTCGGREELAAWSATGGLQHLHAPTAPVLVRFTCITILDNQIVVGGSDGFLRWFAYSHRAGFVVGRREKVGSCILCCCAVAGDVVVGLTSGEVAWVLSGRREKWHQGVVKAVAWVRGCVVSGGDDGVVCVGGVGVGGHRGAVAGVVGVRGGVVSVGCEGSVVLWRWEGEGEGLEKVLEVDGGVEEVGSIAAEDEGDVVVVVGMGVERWRVRL